MADLVTRLFPARRWIGRTTSATLRADAFAGFSNAAIVIPQGVAFATIAGLPPEMGLYTAMITAAIAAFWGSSMVMISRGKRWPLNGSGQGVNMPPFYENP